MQTMRAKRHNRRFVGLALVCVLALTAFVSPALAGKKPWEKFDFPELGDITMPDYQRHVLDNGMVIFLMRDTAWPLVEGRALIRTGAVYEPAAKVGLASVTGDVLRTGGTQTISADELDTKLEAMGAYIESGISDDSGTVSFSFVDKNAAEGLRLVADVLRKPAFEDDKIDVALKAENAGVSRRNDDMFGIVGREIQKAVWGADHPYARHTEYATLDAITREDILEFYEYFYSPNNVMLAVWGNFETDQILAQLTEQFSDWERVDNPVPEIPSTPTQSASRRVMIANKDDVTQARFAVGQVGMRADDPDYYAMQVMNRILGGGFGDRLFNEVRSNLGLAYNVGSSMGQSFARPGTFQAYCGTKNETTEKALAAVLGELDKIRDSEVSDEELNSAKEAILNSHVFNFVSREQILNRIVNFEYWGYPDDYLESYTVRVKSVDKAAVQDVAKRRLDPDSFAVVAVGKTDEWDGDLTAFGPVEELDITIPDPEGEEFPPATAETIEKGRAILASARNAMGGNALTNLNGLTEVSTVNFSMQGMSIAANVTRRISWPDRMHVTIDIAAFGQQMLQVMDGESGWSKNPGGISDMGSSDLADSREALLQDPHYVLGHFDGFEVQSLENVDVEGAQAEVVLVRITDDKWEKLFFDAANHMLVKAESIEQNPLTQAVGLQETYFGDYKTVGGIRFPHGARTVHDGDELMSSTTSSIELNPKIDDAIFAKPSS
jgi:predicted Zn-dependent peptidase